VRWKDGGVCEGTWDLGCAFGTWDRQLLTRSVPRAGMPKGQACPYLAVPRGCGLPWVVARNSDVEGIEIDLQIGDEYGYDYLSWSWAAVGNRLKL